MRVVFVGFALVSLLSGCANQLADFNVPPRLSPVKYEGASDPAYQWTPPKHVQPISLTPAEPEPELDSYSLWEDRGGNLFQNPRASKPGDVLTVEIQIDDEASLDNSTNRSRDSSSGYGLDGSWNASGTNIPVPFTFSMDGDANASSKTGTKGTGSIARKEKIDLSVAAVVVRVLPNYNLVIRGSQEIRVNHEVRVLHMTGIVRPEDIDGRNRISYEKIAEARISYGGRGRLTEVQQPAWGQQLLDLISPF